MSTIPTLLIDGQNLGYAAFYSSLKSGSALIPSSLCIYEGFFRYLAGAMKRFGTVRVVFCWDSPVSYRKKLLPTYKAGRRKDKDMDTLIALDEAHKQFEILRNKILPMMGWTTQLYQEGYEADDHMAKYANDHLDETIVLVTSDEDLYQCLRKNRVSIWKPLAKKQAYTAEDLQDEMLCTPLTYKRALALAGCNTDNVPGIHKVGKATAIKYFNGWIRPELPMHKKIKEQEKETVRTNRTLVFLPFSHPDFPALEHPTPQASDMMLNSKGIYRAYKIFKLNFFTVDDFWTWACPKLAEEGPTMSETQTKNVVRNRINKKKKEEEDDVLPF